MEHDPVFDGLRRWFWLVLIAITCVNAAVAWSRSRGQVRADPALAPGYRRLIPGMLVWGLVPWVVMGLGVVLGGARDVLAFLDLRHGDSWARAFQVTVVVCGAWATRWMSRGGAELLVRHPGILRLPTRDPRTIKTLTVVAFVGALLALVVSSVAGP